MTFNSRIHQTLQTLANNPDTVICYVNESPVEARQLLKDIKRLAEKIQQKESGKNWAVYHKCSYHFAIGFFALLESGKNIIIPGNNTQATQENIAPFIDETLGDFDQPTLEISSFHHHDNPGFSLGNYQSTLTIFTSGSSGQPKAITKQLSQFEAELESLNTLWGKQLAGSRIVATVSHQHIYGLLFKVLLPLASQLPFHAEQILDFAHIFQLAEEDVDDIVWIASPAHLKRLNDNFNWAAAQKHWKMIFSSGGPLPYETANAVYRWLGLRPYEVFGSSETGGIAWRQQADASTAWQTLPGVEIKTDNENRLYVKSAHISDSGEWYRSDDSIKLSDEGFRLTGRLDRIIKLEEKRLSLVEMETAITDHPYAHEAYLLVLEPKAGKIRQTLTCTCVLTQAGSEFLANSGRSLLVKALKSHLQNYFELSLIPRKWRFVDQIPVNTQSKVDKTAIISLYDDE